MIKKLLLVMTLLISSLTAANEDGLTFHFHNDTREIVILPGFIPGGVLNPNPKDWVAIYKQGDSNDWKNVQQWSWIKPKLTAHNTVVKIKLDLPDGDYEIRYFENNSYTTFASKKFRLTSVVNVPYITILDSALNNITVDSDNFRFKASHKGSKSWVGLYKKESSIDGSNVIAWTWVNTKDELTNIKFPFLQEGNYELRLFYDNSYKLKAKASFIVKNTIKEKFKGLSMPTATHGYNHKIKYSYIPSKMGRDWIALYKKGASNDWKNVRAWRHVDKKSQVGYLNVDSTFEVGEYELRLFYNNSYKTEGSIPFTLY